MKATICLAGMALAVGSAIAQQGTPQSTPPSTPQTAPQAAPAQTTPEAQTSKDMKSDKNAGAANEMKTKTFKGTLVDASCAGVQSATSAAATTTGHEGSTAAPGTPSNPATPSTPGSETKAATNRQTTQEAANAAAGSANRSAADSAAGSCTVSSSTSQFAMKLDDGRTLALDMVGNDRAKEQIQKNKKWNEAASSGKPIKAKVSGVESGQKLVVSAIH
jgi:hypothetical protein